MPIKLETDHAMKDFYVDVSSDFKYDWRISKHVGDIIAKMTGCEKARFVCNSFGGISNGDCYEITLNDDDDELFYLLKTGFTTIDPTVVSNWREKKKT
jgi:hypothetical protein